MLTVIHDVSDSTLNNELKFKFIKRQNQELKLRDTTTIWTNPSQASFNNPTLNIKTRPSTKTYM